MKNQPIQHFILQVKIVTSALDPEINEKFYVIPGIGNFGDRYFGTEPSYEIFDWNNAHISAFTGLYPDHRISTCLDWCVCRSADPNLHTHGVIPTESIFNLFYTNTSFEWCAIPCIELAMMIVSLILICSLFCLKISLGNCIFFKLFDRMRNERWKWNENQYELLVLNIL